MTAVTSPWIEKARTIGAEVSAAAARDVDERSRFPKETFDALRKEHFLAAFAPKELGGGGATFSEMAFVCGALGQHCAASGMVYAMHLIQLGCLTRHGKGTPFFDGYLRQLAEKELLIASATTEAGVGGNTRMSMCAVDRRADGTFLLEKDAPVISYAEAADDILITARRAPDAARSDQVLVLAPRGDCKLERTTSWDTLGMRGTCSVGFKLAYEGTEERIVPGAYSDISAQTMLPFAHVLWSNLWLGIATDAVNRARAYIRNEARKTPGTQPPGAFRLAELVAELHAMRGFVHGATRDYQEIMDDPEQLAGMAFALRMNNLKISASQKMVEIIQRALMICGITGYRNDTKFSLGRHLRDALSAPLMVANDRIYGSNAAMLLVTKDD